MHDAEDKVWTGPTDMVAYVNWDAGVDLETQKLALASYRYQLQQQYPGRNIVINVGMNKPPAGEGEAEKIAIDWHQVIGEGDAEGNFLSWDSWYGYTLSFASDHYISHKVHPKCLPIVWRKTEIRPLRHQLTRLLPDVKRRYLSQKGG